MSKYHDLVSAVFWAKVRRQETMNRVLRPLPLHGPVKLPMVVKEPCKFCGKAKNQHTKEKHYYIKAC